MANELEGRSFSIGRVFSRAFSTIGSNPIVTLGIAFLFGSLPNLVMNYGSAGFRVSILQRYGLAATFVLGLLTFLSGTLFTMLTQGALVRATVAHSEGGKAGLGESAMAGLAAVVPLFLLSLALGTAVIFGFLLFFVPGVMLYIMWSVAAPALVEERRGVLEAFGRSRALTKGARWSIFGLQLLILVLSWLASAVLGFVTFGIFGIRSLATAAAAASHGFPWWYLLITAILSTLLAAFHGTVQTSLYVELRNWKDGPATGALSDIFA